ncbi:hypothetical protein [Paenibacillus jilunlii]|uniref:hypothetical protein n=1 Tax=Paenibacillus jilunlii TaxID=682956 RepID=UPI00115FE44E|nr:hypothetical protein [Paenibacillus jilunlii]
MKQRQKCRCWSAGGGSGEKQRQKCRCWSAGGGSGRNYGRNAVVGAPAEAAVETTAETPLLERRRR